MHYATRRKEAGCSPDVAIELFWICLILPAALGSEVYSTSNRNEYQKQKKMFLWSRARPTLKTENFTAFCEPIV
jgi:hypothetical protein